MNLSLMRSPVPSRLRRQTTGSAIEPYPLAACDGPPGKTLGGRYGLLPVLGDRLPAGSVILLDDATRSGEAEVLRRWTTEARMEVSMRESAGGSFAVITRN